MFDEGTEENGDLWDALWDAIVDVRDAYPRTYEDAPTDEVIEAVLDVLPKFVNKVKAEVWNEAYYTGVGDQMTADDYNAYTDEKVSASRVNPYLEK